MLRGDISILLCTQHSYIPYGMLPTIIPPVDKVNGNSIDRTGLSVQIRNVVYGVGSSFSVNPPYVLSFEAFIRVFYDLREACLSNKQSGENLEILEGRLSQII